MSPEPTQEPIKENLNTGDIHINARITTDSDSEEEDVGITGYMPLSQVPIEGDFMLEEDEDDEWMSTTIESNQALPTIVPESQPVYPTETVEVWSTTCNRSNIDLDADKINQVKLVMASFTLPATAIPDWANTVSEEQWKEKLMGRIKEIQSKEK